MCATHVRLTASHLVITGFACSLSGAAALVQFAVPPADPGRWTAEGRRSFLADIHAGFDARDVSPRSRGAKPDGWMLTGTVGDIPGCDYGDSMSMYDQINIFDEVIPLNGQPNFYGIPWSAVAWVVDDSTVDQWPGWDDLGMVIPGGDGQYGTVPRGSMNQANTPGLLFLARLLTLQEEAGQGELFAPQGEEPVIVTVDLYLQCIDTFVLMRPRSRFEGLVLGQLVMGGYDFFGGFEPFTNEDNIIDRFVLAGPLPGDPGQTQFYGADRLVRTNEWISIGFRHGSNNFGWWVKDSGTIGVATAPGFAGEAFEQDWVNIYPGGVAGDAQSAPAEDPFGNKAPSFMEGGVRRVAPHFWAHSFDEYLFMGGVDPTAAQVPGYRPKDWHFDNICVIGPSFVLGCVWDLAGDDNVVNGADLAVLLGDWGSPSNSPADFNGDGAVNGADLALLLGAWGDCNE